MNTMMSWHCTGVPLSMVPTTDPEAAPLLCCPVGPPWFVPIRGVHQDAGGRFASRVSVVDVGYERVRVRALDAPTGRSVPDSSGHGGDQHSILEVGDGDHPDAGEGFRIVRA